MNMSPPLRRSERLAQKRGNSSSTNISIKKIKNSSSTNIVMRPWSDLPPELLDLIAKRLSIIELLAFRSTCKDWRLSSSTSSAQPKTKQVPWFLLYDSKPNCHLYDLSSDNSYTIHIPELDNATCIASLNGWLLMYQDRSMFFFCPFSRAKIDLPEFPHSTLSNPAAVFSSSPMCQDCIVCVVNQGNNTTLELNMIRRGANEWTKHKMPYPQNRIKTITCATFNNGIFYFLDSADAALTFVLGDEKWKLYQVVPWSNQSGPRLPFSSDRVCYSNEIKRKLELKEFDSLSTCGTNFPDSANNICIHNEEHKAEDKKKLRRRKGVWVEPRFFEIPENQSWSL